MRRASKIDANHRAVVDALERAGATVTSLAAVGDGVPDLLVSWAGRWYVMEVKDGGKSPSKRRLTTEQMRWHQRQRAEAFIVLGPEEALQALGMVAGGKREYWEDHCS